MGHAGRAYTAQLETHFLFLLGKSRQHFGITLIFNLPTAVGVALLGPKVSQHVSDNMLMLMVMITLMLMLSVNVDVNADDNVNVDVNANGNDNVNVNAKC